ncbi:mitochondrial assembly of ribosomal large subunit protein 1 [Synchiropus splendidus]|uniref:mitochondrial assembly of ribosomal large subunit protein 1 n=1 Tax=Synchiropus splendidus TaxID=270530 RepID=UPI00237D7C7C|nr:mitochondrial assembly of ribosomal large subunit protein 1 [Synchiropus splendidus]
MNRAVPIFCSKRLSSLLLRNRPLKSAGDDVGWGPPRRRVTSSGTSVGRRHHPAPVTGRWCSDTSRDEYEPEGRTSERAPASQRASETFSLDVLVSLLRQENAVDICVIRVPEQIKYAQYLIVVGGVSSRHLSAMSRYAVKVYKYLKKDAQPHVKVEGQDADDWMCIDFGTMVVHLMLPETRERYELEKLWTLRSCDEQLQRIPAEKIPEDFTYDLEDSQN